MSPSVRRTALVDRLPVSLRGHAALVGNAVSMMSTTLVTSLLGVVFWWIAARYFSQDTVGVGSAAVSAMTLLGFAGSLGMGTLLMGELPRRPGRRRSLLDAALAVTTLAGAAAGVVFAVVIPHFSSELASLGASWTSVLVFGAAAGLTSLGYVVDQALIGMLRGRLQFARNCVFSAAKLLALIPVATLVADAGAIWIYAVWGAGIAVSLLALAGFYREAHGEPLRPDFAALSALRRSAASHHGFNLALMAPSMVVPIVVVSLISADANANFYVAWMIAGFISMVPVSLATVLYAVAASDPSRLTAQLRLTFAVSFGVGLAANLFLLPAANPILSVFGAEYAESATAPLHILALGVFPLTVKTAYVALQRVRERTAAALPVALLGTLFEVGGAALGALLTNDLVGVSWGWLAGVFVEALMMGAPVARALREQGPPAPRPSRREAAAAGFSEPGSP